MLFEYLENSPSTWTFQKLPDVPQEFHDELTRIGGLNRHGQPNLRIVKGNEILSDRTEHKTLKYFCGMSPQDVKGYRYLKDGEWVFTENIDNLDASIMVLPAIEQEPLGLLRYVIEKWTSPEELEYAFRFSQRYGNGDLAPTLREFPREGVYDLYQIVERQDGTFRPVDRDVLDFIAMRLKHEQLSQSEKESFRDSYHERKEEQKEKALDEIWDAAFSMDLRLDPEERERREAYWANYEMYAQDAARL